MTEPAALPENEGFSAFATRLGVKPGYVTQLRKDGRLVLTADGRRVLVAESIARIRATQDPSKAGVRERHAAGRAAKADGQAAPAGDDGALATAIPDAPAGGGDDDDDPIQLNSPHQLRRAKALADKEEAAARKALREEMVEMGQLLVRDEVVAVVADAVVQLRRNLELIAPTIAPALAATDDEDEVRIALRDAIEQAMEGLAKKFGALARSAA